MRRTCFFASLIGAVFAFAIVVWWSRNGEAQQPRPATPPAVAPKPTLPLTEVVLFTSGVGHFQRQGTVEGDARVELTIPTRDVNDLLKSLILEDKDGGKCSAVNYDSGEPMENTLGSFAIDLTNFPNFADLLGQARGEKVEIRTQGNPTVPATLSGAVVGLETQVEGPNKQTVFLNLLTSDGVRTLPLASVQSFRFLNPAVDADFHAALDVLAHSRDTKKKQVSLHFNGEGKRAVRVGYVAESSMWKVNYRLAIDKAGKLRLQAFAVIENTGDEDWNDVRLTLVSARPISFRMDQYQALFVPRPTVEPELFALLRPPVFEGGAVGPLMTGGLGGLGGGLGGLGGGLGGLGSMGTQMGQQPSAVMSRSGLIIDPTTGLPQLAPPVLTYEQLQERRRAQTGKQPPRQTRDAKAVADFNYVAAAAPADNDADLDEAFEYVIDQKVSVARQKCALIPILDEEVKGQRVTLYCPRSEANTPLLGLRFKNATGKPLLQGPVTVSEKGQYAGDARLLDLRAGDERYLAYAVDMGMEIKTVEPPAVAGFMKKTPGARSETRPDGTVLARWPTTAKLVKGYLQVTTKEQLTTAFLLKNRAREDRTLVLEHPVEPQWRLISPKPLETAHDFYRIEETVPAGKVVRVDLVRERDTISTVTVASLDSDSVKFYLGSGPTSPDVKAAIPKILDRAAVLKVYADDLAGVRAQWTASTEEQARVRSAITNMPKESEFYKRTVAKFDALQLQIERLEATLVEKDKAFRQKLREHEEYLELLNVD